MKKKDVLITDYVDPVLLEGLYSMGYTLTYAPEMTRSEIEIYMASYKGVIINTRCGINRKTLESANELRWIGRLGSGLDIIDLEAARERNVKIHSAPEGNAQAVAEHAMAMLLCLANKLLLADMSVREGSWLREKHRGWEIEGRTIGIIGHGHTGGAFGRLWKGWNVKVLAFDKYLKDHGTDNVKAVDLDTLLQQADIISLHVPLTQETREMVNVSFLSRCKKGCVLINTSRGRIVHTPDLVASLQNDELAGACIDVFASEPPMQGTEEFKHAFEELCKMDQVVLSPHIAGWSKESKRKIAEVLIEKIKKGMKK